MGYIGQTTSSTRTRNFRGKLTLFPGKLTPAKGLQNTWMFLHPILRGRAEPLVFEIYFTKMGHSRHFV